LPKCWPEPAELASQVAVQQPLQPPTWMEATLKYPPPPLPLAPPDQQESPLELDPQHEACTITAAAPSGASFTHEPSSSSSSLTAAAPAAAPAAAAAAAGVSVAVAPASSSHPPDRLLQTEQHCPRTLQGVCSTGGRKVRVQQRRFSIAMPAGSTGPSCILAQPCVATLPSFPVQRSAASPPRCEQSTARPASSRLVEVQSPRTLKVVQSQRQQPLAEKAKQSSSQSQDRHQPQNQQTHPTQPCTQQPLRPVVERRSQPHFSSQTQPPLHILNSPRAALRPTPSMTWKPILAASAAAAASPSPSVRAGSPTILQQQRQPATSDEPNRAAWRFPVNMPPASPVLAHRNDAAFASSSPMSSPVATSALTSSQAAVGAIPRIVSRRSTSTLKHTAATSTPGVPVVGAGVEAASPRTVTVSAQGMQW